MGLIRVCFILLLLCGASSIFAQSFNPYERILDPLAIADLGSSDSTSSHHEQLVHGGYDMESDGYRVFTKLRGPGVVSHIWITAFDWGFDTSALMKLTVDDSLLYEGKLSEFFLNPVGRFASTLNRQESGGLVSDVQITFQRDFKITYKGTFSFYALSWRQLDQFDSVPSFRAFDTFGVAEQRRADGVFAASWIKDLPSTNEIVGSTVQLLPGEEREIFSRTGSGVIQSMSFNPELYEPEAYRDLWLKCYWDENSVAAIDVPLADLFGAAYAMPTINALQLKVDPQNGFASYIPMPFRYSAKIVLINKSTKVIRLRSSFSILNKYDRDYGELHCQFNTTPKPRVYHTLPIAHAKGRGRVLGIMFNMPLNIEPSFLEANPFLTCDSSEEHFLEYPGTEDYFNGGWYFRKTPFSGPFAGAPLLYSTLYRFHYLDGINFNTSLDWEWQNGANSDYGEYYRSVSYFYLRPTQFHASQDSLVRGASLFLRGIGYQPSSSVLIELGDSTMHANADATGRLTLSVNTTNWQPGYHDLQVNGVRSATGITVLSAPSINYVVDSQYSWFSIFDSIEVRLNGFEPHSKASIFLGSKKILESVELDDRGAAHTYCAIGRMDSGTYTLSARTANLTASDPLGVNVTRTIRYEIEKLLPALDSDCAYANAYMGWWPAQHWSDMRIVFVGSSQPGQGITLGFDAPYDNIYEIRVGATKGLRYANAAVKMDGQRIGAIQGYSEEPNLLPLKIPPVSLGEHTLSKGRHTIRFEVEDRDPRALEWVLGPDVMFITSKGVFPSSIDTQPASGIALQVFYSASGEVGYRMTLPEDRVIDADLSIFDILGRRIQNLKNGLMGGTTEAQLVSENSRLSLANGVYYLCLRQSSGETMSVPFVLSR